MKQIRLITVLFFLFLTQNSFARPEYSARWRTTRCTACHVSPAGGGIRTLNGKQFGARNWTLNKISNQDLIQAEARMLYYKPENYKTARSGFGVMAGSVAANLPVIEYDQDRDLRLILSQMYQTFNGPMPSWDSYVRFKFYGDTDVKWYSPQYLTVGVFHAPFGLLTDEHRGYTRIQSESDWNTKLESGLMLSGNFSEALHYDVMAINGESAAGSIGAGQASFWGSLYNLRFNSSWSYLPILLGISGKHYERLDDQKNPWATSVYGVLPFERAFSGYLKGSLSAEWVRARYMNESASTFFIGDANFKAAVLDSQSEGMSWMAEFDLIDDWSIQYRYETLEFDRNFSGDAFVRNVYGFKKYLAPNTLLLIRHESARAGRPEEQTSEAKANQNAVAAYLQISI